MFDDNYGGDGGTISLYYYSGKFDNVVFSNQKGTTVRVSTPLLRYAYNNSNSKVTTKLWLDLLVCMILIHSSEVHLLNYNAENLCNVWAMLLCGWYVPPRKTTWKWILMIPK